MMLPQLLLVVSLLAIEGNSLSIQQPDHSAGSTWLTRTSNSYQIHVNDTDTGVVSSKDVPLKTVNQRIHSLVDDERYDRDTKMLRRYWNSLNSSFHFGQDASHEHLSDSLKLNSFYLHHAQCRQCVAHNMDLIGATHRYQSSDDPLDIPTYAPARMMKWCAFDWSKYSTNEQSITELGHVLSDHEGYCVDANDECPGVTVDLDILDQSTCHGDDAQDKQSCEMCVLDDYVWQSRKSDAHELDSYDGSCMAHHLWTILIYDPSRRSIQTLDQCPDRAPKCSHDAVKLR